LEEFLYWSAFRQKGIEPKTIKTTQTSTPKLVYHHAFTKNKISKDAKAGLLTINSSKVLVSCVSYFYPTLRERLRATKTNDKDKTMARPPSSRQSFEFSGFQHLRLPIARTDPLTNMHGHPQMVSTPRVGDRSRR
jgi:hypothetical protein